MTTIMLDVDGVLVSGRPQDGAHLFTDLEADLGVSLEVLQREFFAARWTDIVTGQKPLMAELSSVLAKIAPSVDAKTLVDYWFVNDSRIERSVLDAVAQARSAGYRVYLATNQEHMRANYLMHDMGLQGHVDGIFYSAAIGFRKPAKEFFAHATNAVQCSPSSITLIDDTQENVFGARAYGWNAVHWKPGMALDQALASVSP